MDKVMARVESLCGRVKKLENEHADVVKSLEFQGEEIEELKAAVKELEEKSQQANSDIQRREQKSALKQLTIAGIPEKPSLYYK